MAKFDEEKFRASAKAAGYSDAEIDAELKTTAAPAGSAVPNIVPIADGRETTAAFATEAEAKQKQLEQEAAKEKEATLVAPTFDWQNAINSPVGYVTGAGALAAIGGLGYAAAKKTGLLDRKIGNPEINRTIDIPMETVEKRNVSPFAQQFETTYGVPLSTAEQLTGGPITNPKDASIVGNALKNQVGISVNNPYQTSGYTPATFEPSEWLKSGMIGGQQTQAPAPFPVAPNAPVAPVTSNAPIAPIAPIAPVAPTTSVQAGVANGNPAPAVQSVIAKELDKTTGAAPTLATFNRDANGNIQYPKGMSAAAKQGAEAFAQQYPDHAKALAAEGRFGILGAGSGDNNLFNSYGSDMMKRIRDEVNQGQMVGPYANYETKVNPAIKGISPESAIGKDLAQLREAQIGGNYGPLGTPASIGGKKGGLIQGTNMVAKAVKVGGPAALLMSIADAANAATQGNAGRLRESAFDVGLSAVPNPIFQAANVGLTGTTLEPGTLPTTSSQAFERNVLSRKGVKEELARLTEGKTGQEYNAIRDQYLYGNPLSSDYARAVQVFQKQARQPSSSR